MNNLFDVLCDASSVLFDIIIYVLSRIFMVIGNVNLKVSSSQDQTCDEVMVDYYYFFSVVWFLS